MKDWHCIFVVPGHICSANNNIKCMINLTSAISVRVKTTQKCTPVSRHLQVRKPDENSQKCVREWLKYFGTRTSIGSTSFSMFGHCKWQLKYVLALCLPAQRTQHNGMLRMLTPNLEKSRLISIRASPDAHFRLLAAPPISRFFIQKGAEELETKLWIIISTEW